MLRFCPLVSRSSAGARWRTGFLLGLALAGMLSRASASSTPSAHEVVADVRARLVNTVGAEGLARLDLEGVERLLTTEERRALGRSFLRFRLTRLAVVSVLHIARNPEVPFWLQDEGFALEEGVWVVGGNEYRIWSRTFPAGPVGLGVPSLRGRYDPYFVAVRPADGVVGLQELVTDVDDGLARVRAEEGARPYADSRRRIEALPASFVGATVIATLNEAKDAGRLVELFRLTRHESGRRPDQVVLLPSDDPVSSQAVRWRTDETVSTGIVVWREASGRAAFDPNAPDNARATASSSRLETPDVANDPVVHLHAAVMRDLQPATAYLYAVGDGTADGWSEPASFVTAPAKASSFTFVYLGDAQNGLDAWGDLLRAAHARHPEAAFYLLAGDLINSGQERDDWDRFFANAAGVFDRRTLVPAIGNHEDQGGHPTLYLRLLPLPHNGPAALEPGRAYTFAYGQALFVVLDSNAAVEAQADWLDRRLRESPTTWRFAMYHHPAYPSRPGRSYPEVNRHWVPLFDRHGVDIAFQGHDHAYLRTHPMRAGAPVVGAESGTVYLISVSGTKMYPQGEHAYTAAGFTGVPTYQVITIDRENGILRYRAVDREGTVRDAFELRQPRGS